MDIKISFYLFFVFTLSILGGCSMDQNQKQKSEEQQIIDKATERTVNFFKEKQNLEVVITDHEFGPSDLQVIFISGYVKDDKGKTFDVAVQYGGNKYTIGSISKSENLQLK
ncbi:hypothetical protein HWX41_07825 [Bacillus paramycoides]|uniref:hypothetical protein n=1 Tax=Bacillus paramycoides TaxID=2026194 RepID=UPI0015B81956|nr:hypothetical protein [Bacillus paramycoides]NWK69009.1 hypothetical protein [Bacillus paramycoides]